MLNDVLNMGLPSCFERITSKLHFVVALAHYKPFARGIRRWPVNFPSQRTSNAKSVFKLSRHPETGLVVSSSNMDIDLFHIRWTIKMTNVMPCHMAWVRCELDTDQFNKANCCYKPIYHHSMEWHIYEVFEPQQTFNTTSYTVNDQ